MSTNETEPKKRGRDPEFMRTMREKAAVKKAEQKKIKDAQKLKEIQQHHSKLKEAEAVLNPPKPKPTPITDVAADADADADDEPTNNNKMPSKQKQKQTPAEINYKQEYYRHKLEMLKEKQPSQPKETAPVSQDYFKPLPHRLLKEEFSNDMKKTVMKELWKKHFRTDTTPYD